MLAHDGLYCVRIAFLVEHVFAEIVKLRLRHLGWKICLALAKVKPLRLA